MAWWEWAGTIVVVLWAIQLGPIVWSLLFPPRLADHPAISGKDVPRVSVIMAARDEAQNVAQSLERLLSQDYLNYEVIAVNDRSQDTTGELMESVSLTDSRCRVIHVSDLPSGWLGKNHANKIAAEQATGEILLFTDGDVMMEPSVLARSVGLMNSERLDHLTTLPGLPAGGYWESLLLTYFTFLFALRFQPGLAKYRWVKESYVGVGAFNMVRRSAYESVGGHNPLRMEVLDDVMFGKLMKRSGFKQDFRFGDELVVVKWQTGVWGTICGLEKNAFAGMLYSVTLTFFATTTQLALSIAPLVLSFFGPVTLFARIFYAMTLVTFGLLAVRSRFSVFVVLVYPVASILMSVAIFRSMFLTIARGGVNWRDTFYPLEELRRDRFRM